MNSIPTVSPSADVMNSSLLRPVRPLRMGA